MSCSPEQNVGWEARKHAGLVYCPCICEMFDFPLAQLKQRIGARIKQLHATSSTPLIKAVQWSFEPRAWNSEDTAVQTQAT